MLIFDIYKEMNLKSIIKEELIRSETLKENFFKKNKDPLKDLHNSFKNVFINLRQSTEHPYKMDYFSKRLKTSLEKYKNHISKKFNTKSLERLNTKFNSLFNEIDESLIKDMGLDEFVSVISGILNRNMNLDRNIFEFRKFVDYYINSIDGRLEKVLSTYSKSFKEDTGYDVFKSIKAKPFEFTIEEFEREDYFLQIELMKLQEWAVEKGKKVLIIFEGRDAAGKGSNIEYLTQNMNPKNYRVETWGIPTEDEKKKWFKRYKEKLPKEGEIVLFDRSWYNRAVVEPVMGYCTDKQYNKFMNDVKEFENYLNEKEVILIKLWFSISKDVQTSRFEHRQGDPLRYWKYSENDANVLEKWDDFTHYIDEMFKKTNTKKSPWYVIDADDRYSSLLGSAKTILNKINYKEKDKDVLKEEENNESVIFLDIHGTLIPKKIENGKKICDRGYDSNSIEHLNQLCQPNNSKIVLISTCRNYEPISELKNALAKAGVKCPIVSKTPNIQKNKRGLEIETWLENHPNVNNFVVLDDEPKDIDDDFPKNYIQLDPIKVFSSKFDLNKAKSILNQYL